MRELTQPSIQHPANVLYDRRLYQDFLVALLQSTASLSRIVEIAKQVLNTRSRISLPSRTDLLPLRNCVLTVETLGGVLSVANSRNITYTGVEDARSPAYNPDSSHDTPLHWVPAAPWTWMSNDESVSELVSTFFVRLNPYWRFLDEAVFLRHMRSKNIDSIYCSPLLVNSVLASASVSGL